MTNTATQSHRSRAKAHAKRPAHSLLTPEKAERLQQIEQDIELGRKEFHYKAGMGLAEINRDKLYKKVTRETPESPTPAQEREEFKARGSLNELHTFKQEEGF